MENKNLKITIHKIKSIQNGILNLPMENGLYAIVGNNGTGKSTIMYSMAQLINRNSLYGFKINARDDDSFVEFEYNGRINRWNIKRHPNDNNKVFMPIPEDRIRINGMYEGSLFFGFRFQNDEKVRQLIYDKKIHEDMLIESNSYIVKQLGFILHGDETYYTNSHIVRLKNYNTVKKLGLKETPYFIKENNAIYSQYEMSSGECLMLSLLHFIYYSIVLRSLDPKQPVLMLIDEVEVALHPIAISRFLDLLADLVNERKNLIIYITSHSPEVIRKINPRNIFKIELNNGNTGNSLDIVNPCYPSYAIRDVFMHDGFDWLLLVEDKLAKILLERIISDLKLNNSKLIHIAPVGGWQNVLKLQYDLYKNNVLGVGKNIISILDGDIKSECAKDPLYKDLPKRFLPIPSIEKYLKNVLIDKKNSEIFKSINDEFFQLKSLKEIVNDYKNNIKTNDNNGKELYNILLKALKERNVDEDSFIIRIADIIKENVDFSNFNNSIKKLLD